MNPIQRIQRTFKLVLTVLMVMSPLKSIIAQEAEVGNSDRATIIAAAREIMQSARFCALITLDHSGQPQVRTMDPFAPEEDMVIWLGTNRKSRKVQEIRNDPRVTLYYADPQGAGYVSITGTAELVDNPKEKSKALEGGMGRILWRRERKLSVNRRDSSEA